MVLGCSAFCKAVDLLSLVRSLADGAEGEAGPLLVRPVAGILVRAGLHRAPVRWLFLACFILECRSPWFLLLPRPLRPLSEKSNRRRAGLVILLGRACLPAAACTLVL